MSEGYTLQPKELEVIGFENKEFVRAFKVVQRDIHEMTVQHGFKDDDQLIDRLDQFLRRHEVPFDEVDTVIKMCRTGRMGVKLALVHSELSEALESVRKGNEPDSHISEFSGEEAEMADAIIRIMDIATDRNLRLAEAIVAKKEFNRTRPFRHGGKKF